MTARRFEQIGKTPARFWEVELVGCELRMREGVVRGDVTETTETAADPADAEARLAAAIAARKAAGYFEIKRVAAAEASVTRKELFDWREGDDRVLVHLAQHDKVVTRKRRDGETESATLPTIREASERYDAWAEELRRLARTVDERLAAKAAAEVAARDPLYPELEAQCWASPDDPGPWGVLHDWLEERGHRLVVDVAGKRDPEIRPRVAQQFGFVRKLAFGSMECDERERHPLADAVRDWLADPALRWVDAISIGVEHHVSNGYHDVVKRIAEAPCGRVLRCLALDAWETHWWSGNKWCYGHDGDHRMCQPFGDLSASLPALAALEELRIRSGGMGGTLGGPLPRLRVLALESMGMRREQLAALRELELPALRELELATGAPAYGCSVTREDIRATLAHFATLGHLAIRHSDLGRTVIDELLASELLDRLRSLDLSSGVLDDRAARLIASEAPRFRHLASFDLSANRFTPAATARLRDALDNVLVERQRPDEPHVALYEPG